MQAAVANAQANCSEATHCQVHGDTRYITLPAKYLPIMQPLIDLGAATGTSAVVIPLVDLVSPAMQTLIETGYDRGDYGNPTPFQLVPRVNPVKLVTDLINDIPEESRQHKTLASTHCRAGPTPPNPPPPPTRKTP